MFAYMLSTQNYMYQVLSWFRDRSKPDLQCVLYGVHCRYEFKVRYNAKYTLKA